MDSDLAWINGKNWCYADAFKRCIISGAIYHFYHFLSVAVLSVIAELLVWATRVLWTPHAMQTRNMTIRTLPLSRDLFIWLYSRCVLRRHTNYRQQVNSTRGSPGSADNHGEHKVRGGKLAIDQTPDSYVGRGPGDNYSAHVDRFRLR